MEGSTCDRLNAYGELLVLDEETSCAASSALNVGLLAIANTVLPHRTLFGSYRKLSCFFTFPKFSSSTCAGFLGKR